LKNKALTVKSMRLYSLLLHDLLHTAQPLPLASQGEGLKKAPSGAVSNHRRE